MFKKLSEKPVAEVQKEQVAKWKEEDLLHKCVTAREGAPSFVFYEGPPTANGKPGIHHVMARTLKDSINRYKTMQGYQVKRGPAPSGSALLPEIVHEALFDQFADQFGDRRHRQVHFMAQIRDTEIPSHDVVSDQLQFQQSGFIAFFGLSQKRIDHNSQ